MSTTTISATAVSERPMPGQEGRMREVMEDPLPAEFPVPRPRGVREIVLDRDGGSCRLCGQRIDPLPGSEAEYLGGPVGPVNLASLNPGAAVHDSPELMVVRACGDCWEETERLRYEVDASRRAGMVGQLSRLLYLENCEMAAVRPIYGRG